MISTQLDNKTVYGMMNIGVKPTLELEKESIEVNLFDWNKNLYGKEIKVSVIKYVRTDKKFDSLNDLKEQIKLDKKTCIKLIKEK